MSEAYSIRCRVWITGKNGSFLGSGRMALLKAIDNHLSISKAAKQLNISYTKAWQMVDAMNKEAIRPLVVTSSGGSGGGGARITEMGKLAIQQFTALTKRCHDFLDQELKSLTFLTPDIAAE